MPHLSENAKIMLVGPPIDLNSVGMDCAYVDTRNCHHLAFIVGLGVTGGATTITVEKDADGSGSGTAIDFDYRAETTAAGDTLDALAAVGATTGVEGSTNDNVFYVIEIDPASLGDGYPYVWVCLSDPSAGTLACVIAVLWPLRYPQATPPTGLVT